MKHIVPTDEYLAARARAENMTTQEIVAEFLRLKALVDDLEARIAFLLSHGSEMP
jgi:hypothetical protein